jgi:4-hydroxy-tetrahydrodipicolinate synthase
MFDFKGTGVALVTPFNDKKEVDYKALANLIDFIISGGIQYIVSLGTTGETPVLSKEEKKAILEFTLKQVNKRVPVVAGIGGNDTRSVIQDCEDFPLENVVAILSASPYYNKPSQEGLFMHYKEIAAHAPKPIILYNVPGRTGRNMNAATVLRLAKEFDNIIGIKEASGDMGQCMSILKDKPDSFFVVSGDDGLVLPQIACGMHGVISVAANAYPVEFGKMVQLCLANNFSAAKKINDSLIKAYDLMFEENNPAGVKAFLFEMGLIANELRLPLVPLSASVHEHIQHYLKK